MILFQYDKIVKTIRLITKTKKRYTRKDIDSELHLSLSTTSSPITNIAIISYEN